MEFLEAVSILPGWNYRFFHGAVDACLRCGRFVLSACVCDDRVHHCVEADFRGPCVGLAVSGMYHFDDRRRSVFLYGDFGAIYGENLYGSKA